MSVKTRVNRIIDRIFGTASAPELAHAPVVWNRHARRTDVALRLKQQAAPARKKFEKRGADGRSSKGRKPFRG